jgi:hypothetical protein
MPAIERSGVLGEDTDDAESPPMPTGRCFGWAGSPSDGADRGDEPPLRALDRVDEVGEELSSASQLVSEAATKLEIVSEYLSEAAH